MDKIASLETISRWEKEINNLGGNTEKWGIMSSAEAPAKIEVSANVSRVVFSFAAGSFISVPAAENEIAVPTTQVVSAAIFDHTDAHIDTFRLNEGHGIYIYGENGIEGKLSDENVWVVCQTTRTWQDKVDLAHMVVENDVLTALYNRLSAYTDAQIMASIQNINALALSVDLKALELIFSDLANSGFNQLYQTKATEYARRYRAELDNALKRLSISIDGELEPKRVISQGRLVR